MSITILVTDRNLAVIGAVGRWTKLDVVSRFNEPGSGTLVAPARPELMSLIAAGNRVVVVRDGAVYSAGPVEASEFRWSTSDQDGPGEVAVTWAEDLALVVGHLAYPDPAETASGTQADYWVATSTNAEVAMRELVDVNAGPSALPERRVPRLALGDVAGVGTTISHRARWEPVGDVLREMAIAGGGLGFRTRQEADTILFEVFAPRDLTSSVRFSRDLGNLREVTYRRTSPRLSAAIVGGQGDLNERTIVERVNTTAEGAWWRVEQFVDQRQTDDGDELVQAGDAALEDGAETAQLSTVTIDTPMQRYGIHYGLGDRVTVVPRPGVEVAEVVRSAHLEATPTGGEMVTVLVGSQSASSDPLWLRRMRELDRRLARLETNVTTGTV